MSDRELLEMAAKAAGLAWEWNACAGGVQHIPRGLRHYVDWNPLTSDGDALRLVAKLKLSIDFMDGSVWRRELDHSLVLEYFGGDHDPCYRRAITRAAAAIGAAL